MIPIFNRGHVFSSCLDSYVIVVIDVFVNNLLKLIYVLVFMFLAVEHLPLKNAEEAFH